MKNELPSERNPFVHNVHQDLSSILPDYATLNEERLVTIMSVDGVLDFFNNWIPLKPGSWKNDKGAWTLKMVCLPPNGVRLSPLSEAAPFPDSPPIAIISPYVCSGLRIVCVNLKNLKRARIILLEILKTLYFSDETVSIQKAEAVLRGLRGKFPKHIDTDLDMVEMHNLENELARLLSQALGLDLRPHMFKRFSTTLAVSLLDTGEKWVAEGRGSKTECYDAIEAVALFPNGQTVFLQKVETLDLLDTPPCELLENQNNQDNEKIQKRRNSTAHVRICPSWTKLCYGDIPVTFRTRKRDGYLMLKVLYEKYEAEKGVFVDINELKESCGLTTAELRPMKVLFSERKLTDVERAVFSAIFSKQKNRNNGEWEVRLNPRYVYSISEYEM